MTINYITEVTSTLLLNLANSAIVSTLSSAAQSSFVQLTVGVATICYLTRNVETKPQKEISEMDKLIGRLYSNIFSERYKLPYFEKTKRILTQFPRAEDRKRLVELELYFIEAAKCCEWDNDDKIILLEKFAEIFTLSKSQENIITEALKLLKTHYQFATAEEVMELLQMIADLPHHDRASVIKYANEWIKKHGCGHSQDLPALIEAIARIKADKKSEEMTEAFLENLDQFFDRNYRLLDNTPEKNRQKIGFLHALAHIKPNLQGKAFKLMKKFIGDENYLFGKIIHPENHITLLDFMSENEEIGEDLAKIAEPYWLLDTKWGIFSQFAKLNKQEQTELAEFLMAVTR
ncbi:MAG TPA: hypothetical protein DCE71_08085, partial [Parachlamydiales bacterium]|nr:hypothetical protein [Parachlamydiales bacterium]